MDIRSGVITWPEADIPMGELDAVNTDNPFHSINAVERTRAKLRTWASDCRVLDRLEPRKESMAGEETEGLRKE